MNSSGKITSSAPWAAASARARRASSALAATAPTVGLTCAIAIARRSGGRGLMRMMYAGDGRCAIGRGGRSKSERRLRLQQHAIPLGAELGQREIGPEGRAELDRSGLGEDAPVARADAELEVRQDLVVEEGFGLGAHAAPAAGDDVR